MSPVTNIFLIVFVVAIVIIIIVIIVEFCWQKAPAFLESMTAPTNWPPAPSTNDGASRYYTDVRCHQTCPFSSIQNTSCGTPCEPWQRNIYLIEWSSPSPPKPLNNACLSSFVALHCTSLECTALQGTALHCTALYCTALHCAYVFLLAFPKDKKKQFSQVFSSKEITTCFGCCPDHVCPLTDLKCCNLARD